MDQKDLDSQYLTSWRLAVVILSLFLGTFLIALDTNIVTVAIPHISAEFQALRDVSWYGSAYLLTITAFQPIFGVLYKFFSVEIVYKTCVVLFEIGSTVCATATSSPVFIFGRALAGVGAAGLLQGALSVIGHVVVLEKRSMYIGIVVSVFVLSVCVGPVLGGLFTTHATWRWCFWINLPCGVITLILLTFFLRINNEDSQDRKRPLGEKLAHLEPVGCLTFIGGITCIILALQWGGQTMPWNSSTIVALFVGFILFMMVFFIIQWIRDDRAMIPLRVLRQRTVWTSALVLFLIGCTTYLDAFYLPFYFQAVQGVDAIASGLRLMPLMLSQVVSLVIAGAVVSKIGHYVPVMLVGEVVAVVGSALLVTLQVDTRTAIWATFLVITGAGLGTAMQLPYTAIQVALSSEDIAVANAIAIFSSQLGGAIAIAAGQSVTLNILLAEAKEKLPDMPVAVLLSTGVSTFQPTNIPPEIVAILKSIWTSAVTKVFILALATVILSIPFTCAMEWLNAKAVAANSEKGVHSKVMSEDPTVIDQEKGDRASFLGQ